MGAVIRIKTHTAKASCLRSFFNFILPNELLITQSSEFQGGGRSCKLSVFKTMMPR